MSQEQKEIFTRNKKHFHWSAVIEVHKKVESPTLTKNTLQIDKMVMNWTVGIGRKILYNNLFICVLFFLPFSLS